MSAVLGVILSLALLSAELHELSARHVHLTTDVAREEVAALPAMFDAAVEAWRPWLGLEGCDLTAWHVRACLVADEQSFAATNLLRSVPELRHGFSRRNHVWLREQPSAYYRTHLLLHEGVHALMDSTGIGDAPPWYREGMAELLSTFRMDDSGAIFVGEIPRRAGDVPMWGRIAFVREAMDAARPRGLDEVLAMTPADFDALEGYVWGWALCVFLAHHPQHAAFFRTLPTTRDQKHSQKLREHWATTPNDVERDWIAFLDELAYGVDVAACIIDQRNIGATKNFTIDAARGWHATGVILERGERATFTATGRFSLGTEPSPWWSEANGITIRYAHGVPIGTLEAAILDDAVRDPRRIADALGHPIPIGSQRQITLAERGRLYLRLADTRGARGDNSGVCTVAVTRDR